MWVAAVVLHGHAYWVSPLVGERPCCRRYSGPGYVRRVVWGYRVKPIGEPCLLVGGGGSRGMWVEMRCSRGHGVSRAAGLQCQHVRGMPWSLCLNGGTSVSCALCFGMDQGEWCRWTVRVACLWPLLGGVQPSADGVGSPRVVLPSLAVWCSLKRGRGCWRWKALYAVSKSLGPGMSRPAFVAHARRYAWKTRRTGHCCSEREQGMVGVPLGHDLHLCWGDICYCDGAPHEAQGIHLARRVSVDVAVRGHEWPLLIAKGSLSGWPACGAVAGVAAAPRCQCPQRWRRRVAPVSTGGRCWGPFALPLCVWLPLREPRAGGCVSPCVGGALRVWHRPCRPGHLYCFRSSASGPSWPPWGKTCASLRVAPMPSSLAVERGVGRLGGAGGAGPRTQSPR